MEISSTISDDLLEHRDSEIFDSLNINIEEGQQHGRKFGKANSKSN